MRVDDRGVCASKCGEGDHSTGLAGISIDNRHATPEVSDISYQGQLQGPRRSAHDDFQPLGWGRSASWVNGPDQGRSSLTIDETFSIESIQGSVLFLMSNRFDRFDWIYSLSGSIVHAQVLYAGVGPADARAARLS